MSAAAILERLQRQGLRVRRDGEHVILGPREKVTAEVVEVVRRHKPELLEALRDRTLAPTYTRCLDCLHYDAPPPDTAFWCPLVKGRPRVGLLAICTAYVGRP